MNILIQIHTDSELIGYEAMSLGFVLASFDHHVQFYFDGDSTVLLKDPTSRLYGMIQSLDLYDIATAWTAFLLDEFDEAIKNNLTTVPNLSPDEFDGVLHF